MPDTKLTLEEALRVLDPPDPPAVSRGQPVVIRPWEEAVVVQLFRQFGAVAYGERGTVRMFRGPQHPEAAALRLITDPKTILVETWSVLDEAIFPVCRTPAGAFTATGRRMIRTRVATLTRRHGPPVYWVETAPGCVTFYSGRARRPLSLVTGGNP